jgi:thiamine biosynthesis lipoprotein
LQDLRRQWCTVLAVVALSVFAGCHSSPRPLRLSGETMGTTYAIVVTALPPGVTRGEIESVVAGVLDEVDQHLSGWNPGSELAAFNRSRSTDWQPVSTTLYFAVAQARSISVASGGAYDVTVAPLVRAWGFGAGSDAATDTPRDDELAALLAHTGHERLELREPPPALRKAVAELEIDVDGIAPGWAVDRIAERFDTLGLDAYLVELGGEVRARGLNPEGRGWRVAVEVPLPGERRAQAVIELGDRSVSTSGDYRDYREVDGRRISHTIDPRTGRPVEHGLASVTVVHPSAAAADAWATALMVLGTERGLVLARAEGLAALFIARGAAPGSFVEHETEAFARLRVAAGARL